ncbi:MAG: hypothetical protein EA380_05560 [Phycisphaeraceae bacterium]|nr:MAG: hypothetical protein EA380_05560 [Phycisphaeraceae bacterium]
MHRIPGWSFEHVPRKKKRRLIFALFRTLLRSLLPWKFWRTVELRWPVRKKRLTLYAIVLMLLGIFTAGILIDLALAVTQFPGPGRYIRTQTGSTIRGIYAPATNFPMWYAGRFDPTGVGASHAIWNGSVYLISMPLQFLPLNHQSWAPRWWRSERNFYQSGLYFYWGNEELNSMAGWTLLLGGLIPITYLLVSDTLSKAKVSAQHHLRTGVYSTVAACICMLVMLVVLEIMCCFSLPWVNTSQQPGISPGMLYADVLYRYRGPLWLIIPAALAVYWGCIGRWYYRIPHPWTASVLLTFTSTLMTFVITIGLLGDLFAFPWLAP